MFTSRIQNPEIHRVWISGDLWVQTRWLRQQNGLFRASNAIITPNKRYSIRRQLSQIETPV